ncbi:aminopeptidase P family protein [Kiloniella sp. b19]|uniref:aminopeptidase P family protein n=1 Tax=Kiloniella sp. GXU_MW_B19 TaxID=3141326 RepID=UPI0031DE7DA2
MAEHGQRLEKLRELLREKGLDGFVVPRTDEHQGEYVPPSAERLKWLSGFSGSAGHAIVLQNKAAIFVDGRYTIQVREQVDGELFEYCHLIDDPSSQWLATNTAEGSRIAYDPWMHSENQIKTLSGSCEGFELVPLDVNPVDSLWDDQPAAPVTEAFAHNPAIAGEGASEKIVRIAEGLVEQGADATVLTLPDSVVWLLNVRGADVSHTPLVLSFAIVRSSGAVDWFVDPAKITDDVRASLPNSVAILNPASFDEELDGLAGGRVSLDPATAPVRLFQRLEKAGAEIVRAQDPCQLPKACKNESELQGSRVAHERDALAMVRFLKWLEETALPRVRSGDPLTEIEVEQKLLAFRQALPGFSDLSFDTISAAGPHAAICHYKVDEQSNRALLEGETFLIDSGAQFPEGTTDITRTVYIGTPDSALGQEISRRFTLVLKGMIALSMARFPEGTTGTHLDAIARGPLWAEGLDFDHGTGHGVGAFLGVHEGPQRISKAWNTNALKTGMILSNEPGYYKAEGYGIRIENLIIVQPMSKLDEQAAKQADRTFYGFETLTLCPIERELIMVELLTVQERQWLDAYHKRVRETLGQHLEPDVRKWLEEKTAPL